VARGRVDTGFNTTDKSTLSPEGRVKEFRERS
jgi:hypothetical protein